MRTDSSTKKNEAGTQRVCAGARHAAKFDDRLIDISALHQKLGTADYKPEIVTQELLNETKYITPPKGWWIAPLIFLIVFGGGLIGLLIALFRNH